MVSLLTKYQNNRYWQPSKSVCSFLKYAICTCVYDLDNWHIIIILYRKIIDIFEYNTKEVCN